MLFSNVLARLGAGDRDRTVVYTLGEGTGSTRQPPPTRSRPPTTDNRTSNIRAANCSTGALPFHEWSPDLPRALIAVFDLNGCTPPPRYRFRPYLVK